MASLSATLTQMAVLFSLIALGYILVKLNVVPEKTEQMLSRLENNLFLPALILSTFMANFTVQRLSEMGSLVMVSAVMLAAVIPLAFLFSRVLTKDKYLRNIILYSLCFPNFGFMGNAVVEALFPEIITEYTVFTLLLWTAIYVWGAPSLLMGDGHRGGIKSTLKNLVNPMFICVIVGAVIGLSGIKMPKFTIDLVNTLKACMSPVAMLLTGMTIARFSLKKILSVKSVYSVTAIRLLVFPLLFIAVARFLPISDVARTCAFCVMAMPLGLNTIVIPSAYGKDTSAASGMALVSHFFSCITIPLVFALMDFVMAL